MFGGQGVKIGELFGIKIYLNSSWFLIASVFVLSMQLYFAKAVPNQHAFSYWIFGILTAALLFISLLAHEFSHCLMARPFGIVFRSITLLMLGAVAISHTPLSKTTAKAEFFISLAGPLSNFAMAGALLSAADSLNLPKTSLVLESIALIATMNIVLGLFNLLPCFPMDGGRVLRAVLWWRTENIQKATTIAFWAATITCVLLVSALVWKASMWQALWIGTILTFIIRAGYTECRALSESE